MTQASTSGPDGNDERAEAHRRMWQAARLRVLLVEDEANVARLLAAELDWLGFEVRTAGDYREAITTATQWMPDLLIADIGLPGRDGWQLMRRMRQAHPKLKGVVVSGQGGPEAVAASREAGFAAHLVKPVRPEYLASTLREVAAV
ncbi:MAG: response regulator [Phycisphaerae bacterium]